MSGPTHSWSTAASSSLRVRIASIDPGGDEVRVRRAGGRLQLVGDHPLAADRDLERRAADVGDRQGRATELADDGVVRREAAVGQKPVQVLAAPERRLVQTGRDDHELAGERPPFGNEPRRLGSAGERPLHVRRAAPVDDVAFDARRLVRDRHRVEVAVEDDGGAGLAAAEPGDHDRRRGEALVEQLDVQPVLLEAPAVEARHLGGVAGRALDRDQLQGQVAQAISVDAHAAPLATRKPMCA